MKQRELDMMGLAATNHGIIQRSQLLDAGYSPSAIGRLTGKGRIRPFAPGVYLVDHLTDDHSHLVAALASEPRAAASHFTAARIHGLRLPRGPRRDRPEILTLRPLIPRIRDVHAHTTTYLPESHLTRLDELRITTPERTLADTVHTLSPRSARYSVQRAIADRLIDPDLLGVVHLQLARRGRRGTVFTRKLLSDLLGHDGYPMSELEIRTDEMLSLHGILGFISQYRPPWYDGSDGLVDFANPSVKVILEADGRRWHAVEQATVSDRKRDRTALKEGWVVIRFTWAEVVRDPETLCTEIRSIVARQIAAQAA